MDQKKRKVLLLIVNSQLANNYKLQSYITIQLIT